MNTRLLLVGLVFVLSLIAITYWAIRQMGEPRGRAVVAAFGICLGSCVAATAIAFAIGWATRWQ